MGGVSKEVGTVITARTRGTAKRDPDRAVFPEEKAHIQHIGEVIHAWNCAHGALYRVFARIAVDSDYDLALDLWHTASSDNARRGMLEAFVRARFKTRRLTYRSGILWAVAALNQLTTYRNDAAHAEMIYYYDRMAPGMSTKRKTAERYEKAPLSKHWRALRGDLYAIASYLEQVDFSLWFDYSRPLVRKPRLGLASQSSARQQTVNRKTKIASRERQRIASKSLRASGVDQKS